MRSKYLVFIILLCAVLPLTYSISSFRFYTLDAGIFILSLYVFLRSFSGGFKKVIWNRAEKIFLLFILFSFVSAMFSVNKAESLHIAFLWLRYLVLYVCLRRILTSFEIRDNAVVNGVLLILSGLVFIGTIQYLTGSHFGVIAEYLGGDTGSATTGRFRRVSGTTYNSNVFGAWLIIFSVPLISRSLFSVGKTRPYVIFIITCAMLLVLTTLSRSSILFALTVFLAFLLFARSIGSRARIVSVGFVMFLGFTVVFFGFTSGGKNTLNDITGRISQFSDRGSQSRLLVLDTILPVMSDVKNVVIGVGPNVYYEAAAELGVTNLAYSSNLNLVEKRSGIHNIFLKLFTEFGAICLLIFVYFYMKGMLLAHKVYRVDKNIKSMSCLLLLYTILVPAQFTTLFLSNLVVPLLVIVLAYVYSYDQMS